MPRPRGIDLLISSVLAALTFVVHDVVYLLRSPFWLDETWVAVSTKLPISQAPRVTASTPLGWTLLLRLGGLGGIGGEQRYRMVPLLFSALAVFTAYWLVVGLGWTTMLISRLAASAAAIAVLLAPSSLIRNDLKQYTADALLSLIVLAAATSLEREWSRRRLIRLGLIITVGFFFSVAAALVGAAVLVALLLVAAVRREREQFTMLAVASAACAVVAAMTYVLAYRPGRPKGLTSYWAAYYVPTGSGLRTSLQFLATSGAHMSKYLGVGKLSIALVLIACGVATCFWLRRPVLALAAPLLVAEMVVLATMKEYPLFDERTSHFVTVTLAVFAALGVVGICLLLLRIHPSVAVAGLLAAFSLFLWQVAPDVRSKTLPNEDLRGPTLYVAAHKSPGDVIVVSSLSSWGFAYYWPDGTSKIQTDDANLQRFIDVYPDQARIVVATDRTPEAISTAMTKAMSLARSAPAGARVWVIRDHVNSAELADWTSAFAAAGVTPSSVIAGRLLQIKP